MCHSLLWPHSVVSCGSRHVLLIHSSPDGHAGLGHFLTVANNVAVNICAHVFTRTCVFISLGIDLGEEFLGQVVTPPQATF